MGGIQNTIAIPIYRVLPYPVIQVNKKFWKLKGNIVEKGQETRFGVSNTDTECTRAIASSLIHAVVLCESAQRYRALMVILQSHRTQNMILRC